MENANLRKNQGTNIDSLINIMMATNETYVVPTSVTIKSIRKSSVNPVCVYVLYSELSEKSIGFLENLSAAKVKVKCVYISLTFFDSLPTRDYYTKEIYYRLFGYMVLPENIDRIIWLDGDIIVREDLAEFYQYPMDTQYFVAVHDEGSLYNKEKYHVRLGMDENIKYVQSGVMLFNLKQIRSEGTLADDVRNFITVTKLKLYYPDQDLINVLYGDNGKLIVISESYRYNQFAHKIGFFDIKRKGTVCLHYPGNKPWGCKYCNNRLYWWLYAGMFPGKGINIFKNCLPYIIVDVAACIYSRLLNYKCGRYMQKILWKKRDKVGKL